MSQNDDKPLPPWELQPIIIIDCEMSGWEPRWHELISIGHVKTHLPSLALQRGSEIESKIHLRYPKRANRVALRVARYNGRDWANAVEPGLALTRLSRQAKGCLPAGWSFANDLQFIIPTSYDKRIARCLWHGYLEVQDWAQARFYYAHPPGLHQLGKDLKLDIGLKHNSLSDARTTYKILRLLMQFDEQELLDKVNDANWNPEEQIDWYAPWDAPNKQLRQRRKEMQKFIWRWRYDAESRTVVIQRPDDPQAA